MKTTNFEISKKLKEIGFEAEFNFHYKATDPVNLYDSGYEDYKERNTPAYDLETLLEALPKELDKFLGITYLTLNKSNSGINIGYGNDEEYVENLYCWQEENESLADTAGRLLIQLFEAGIINFNK